MALHPQLRIFDDTASLYAAAATEYAARAQAAVEKNGRFSVALSGGSTPKPLYSMLAEKFPSLPWDKSYFFWSDERFVPPDHPDSNYRLARESMLSKAPIPGENIFRVQTEEKDPQRAAELYEQTLQSFFRLKPRQLPRFDLMLLGMGPDGHTASLFPGSAALKVRDRLVVANWVEKFQVNRITFTLPVLNQAACDMFLVVDKSKASALRQVLDQDGEAVPARMVQPETGELLWFVDRAATADLARAS